MKGTTISSIIGTVKTKVFKPNMRVDYSLKEKERIEREVRCVYKC